MTWSATILRGTDDLDVKPFEPVTSNGTILVDSTGETGVTSQTVLRILATVDTALGVAIQEGSVVQVYNGSAWVDDTPSLAFGPMLVREISCVEHPDQPDLWKVDFMASGFGPILTAAGATIGSPQISVYTEYIIQRYTCVHTHITPRDMDMYLTGPLYGPDLPLALHWG